MADWHPSDLGAKLYAFWDFADSSTITQSGGVVSSVALKAGTAGTLALTPGVDGGTVFNPTTDASTFGGLPSLVIGPNKNLKCVVDLGGSAGLTSYVGLKSSTANFRSKLSSFSQSTWDDSEPDSFGMHQHGDGVSTNSVEFYRDGFGGSKTTGEALASTETFSSIFFAGGGGICRSTGKGSNFNTSAAVAFGGSTRFAIGANANADWADHLPSGCYVSFALICIAELTPDEREKLDAWDAWRRGYQSKVRKSSPYALAKPTTADAYLVSMGVTEPYVNNANWQGYTIRQVYPASMLALSGSSIKLSFPPQNINISKCYIGHRSGSTLNFDGTPAQVLFGGSPSASLTVAGGVALFSDATTFALDETKDIIISVYFNATGQSDILQADHDRTGVIRAYTNSPSDDAANVTAASYNTGTTREALVDHIMVSAGATGISATFGVTNDDDTLSAAAVLPIAAESMSVLDNDTLSSSAVVPIVGALTAFELDDTLSSSAVLDIAANASLNEDQDTLASTSTIGDNLSASLAVTDDDDTLLSAGALAVAASLAATNEDDTLAASTASSISVTATLNEDDDTLVATGAAISAADMAGQEEDDTLAASSTIGDALITASAAVTDEDDALDAASSMPIVASGDIFELDDVLTATGQRQVAGEAAIFEEGDVAFAIGMHGVLWTGPGRGAGDLFVLPEDRSTYRLPVAPTRFRVRPPASDFNVPGDV